MCIYRKIQEILDYHEYYPYDSGYKEPVSNSVRLALPLTEFRSNNLLTKLLSSV